MVLKFIREEKGLATMTALLAGLAVAKMFGYELNVWETELGRNIAMAVFE